MAEIQNITVLVILIIKNENTFSYNRTGLEYFGQALINGYNNEQPYQEYFSAEKEPEDYETYGDELTSGFQTTFIQNELFMRLSDTNVTNRKNMIGRFTKKVTILINMVILKQITIYLAIIT